MDCHSLHKSNLTLWPRSKLHVFWLYYPRLLSDFKTAGHSKLFRRFDLYASVCKCFICLVYFKVVFIQGLFNDCLSLSLSVSLIYLICITVVKGEWVWSFNVMIFTRANRHAWRCQSDHPKSLVGSSLGLRAEIPLTKRTSQFVSTKCVLQFHYSRCTSQTTIPPSVTLQFTECRCPISSPG